MRIKNEYNGNARVIFNPTTGLKIRMVKDGYTYDKSETPELVDIKITGACPYVKKCPNCYQSSTIDGQHGDFEYITNIIRALALMNCFEIAIGGGEPATHPNFAEILYSCYENNITPNFTTFGTEWLENEKIVNTVKKYVGGIGVSVYSKNSVQKYWTIKNALKDSKVQVMVQHVAGMFPFKTTYDLVKEVDHILLLGYKSVGFGANKNPTKFTDEQIKEIFALKDKRISVDTAFLDNYGHVLDELGISKILRSSPEGKFSCYIDAVEQKIGQSSYVQPEEMKSCEGFNDININYRAF